MRGFSGLGGSRLRSRGWLLLAAIVLAATFAPDALSYSGGPSSPLMVPESADAVKSILDDPASGSGASGEVQAGLAELETAAGAMPALEEATVVTTEAQPEVLLGLGAGVIGWKIGAPLGGYIYRTITGDAIDTSCLVPGRSSFFSVGPCRSNESQVRWRTGAEMGALATPATARLCLNPRTSTGAMRLRSTKRSTRTRARKRGIRSGHSSESRQVIFLRTSSMVRRSCAAGRGWRRTFAIQMSSIP